MKCDKCGKNFKRGNRPDGIPNGIGFQLQDGRVINVCADCVMSFRTAEWKAWLDAIRGEEGKT